MANRTHLVVMPGDGIGPEITEATLQVVREVDKLLSLGLTFEEVPIGFEALKKHGTTMPDSSFEAGKRADGVILGPVSHNDYPPVAKGGLNPRTIGETIKPARAAKKPVIVDPKSQDFARYKGASVIKPNAKELARASGMACGTEADVLAAGKAVLAKLDALPAPIGIDRVVGVR